MMDDIFNHHFTGSIAHRKVEAVGCGDNAMTLTSSIDLLFAGGLSSLAPERQRTGIYKRELSGPVRVVLHGIEGDEHGDLRVHGGPEKAVHHYAAENYARLAHAFSGSASALV